MMHSEEAQKLTFEVISKKIEEAAKNGGTHVGIQESLSEPFRKYLKELGYEVKHGTISAKGKGCRTIISW